MNYASPDDVYQLASRLKSHQSVEPALKLLDLYAGQPVESFDLRIIRSSSGKSVWQLRSPVVTGPGSVSELADDLALTPEHPFITALLGRIFHGHPLTQSTYRSPDLWWKAVGFQERLWLAELANQIGYAVSQSFYAPEVGSDWVTVSRETITSPVFVYTTSEPEEPTLAGLLA